MEQDIRTEGKAIYRSTLGRLNLPFLEREVVFESSFCQSRFAKDYYIAARNMAMVSAVGPTFAPTGLIEAAEEVIEAGTKKMLNQVGIIEKRLEEIAKGAGIKELASFTQPYKTHAQVYHRLSNRHLDLLEAMDRCVRLAWTLEMKSEIKTTEFREIVAQLRGKHLGWMGFTKKAYVSVIQASKRRNQAAGEKLEAANAQAEAAGVSKTLGGVDGPVFTDQLVADINAATAELAYSSTDTAPDAAMADELSPSSLVAAQRAEEFRAKQEETAAKAKTKAIKTKASAAVAESASAE